MPIFGGFLLKETDGLIGYTSGIKDEGLKAWKRFEAVISKIDCKAIWRN